MNLAVVIAARTVSAFLSIFSLLLLVRAILSWVESLQDNPICEFLDKITEPIVAPVRALLHKMEFFRNSPLDLAPLTVMILISLLQGLLSIFVV